MTFLFVHWWMLELATILAGVSLAGLIGLTDKFGVDADAQSSPDGVPAGVLVRGLTANVDADNFPDEAA